MSNPFPFESARSNTIDLAATGMHCGACVALVERVLTEQPGVRSVEVDLGASTASVTIDPAIASVDVLCVVVTDAGYGASVIQPPEAS